MKEKRLVHKKEKILVVGTTSDYIDWIQTNCPGRALFLTEPEVRKNAQESSPKSSDEMVIVLNDFKHIKFELKKHLKKRRQKIIGVACFDCEFLEIASKLAFDLGVEYPDVETIRNCRDKYISKKIWHEHGVRCPETIPVNSIDDATRFLSKSEQGIVLKPFYGSGSELVFRCRTEDECKNAFEIIKEGLKKRRSNPLFQKKSSQRHLMLAEKFILGPEYSSDFIIDKDTIKIIRITQKIKPSAQPFGTVSGYVLPAVLPPRVDPLELETTLLRGAHALGIKRGLCMVDFILGEHDPILIEMTPRPGGDCLPFLLKEAGNLDILGLTLDFAEHKMLQLNGSIPFTPHIGLRIHAKKSGVFKGINTEQLSDEPRVKKIHLIRKPGHLITMPPIDYDSWLLGHMIIQPNNYSYPETQCFLIGSRLQVEIEQ